MTTPLTITVDRRDGGAVALVASGEIDLSNVRAFADALADAVAETGGGKVTVDLSAIDYVDSGGINVLFTHADHIRVIVKPLLLPVLVISGLTELAPVDTAAPRPGD